MTTVTVIIPVHTPRVDNGSLRRALNSVWRQTRLPDAVIVQHDSTHEGSARTRNTALASVQTEWVAFLDSDDELRPGHLDTLLYAAAEHGADVVYPGCDVLGGHDPHDRFGKPFDPDLLRDHSYIPVTSLVRTGLALQAGGFCHRPGSPYDDWCFYLSLLDAGAIFFHVPVRTWIWHHHGVGAPGREGNTSGSPTRW